MVEKFDLVTNSRPILALSGLIRNLPKSTADVEATESIYRHTHRLRGISKLKVFLNEVATFQKRFYSMSFLLQTRILALYFITGVDYMMSAPTK